MSKESSSFYKNILDILKEPVVSNASDYITHILEEFGHEIDYLVIKNHLSELFYDLFKVEGYYFDVKTNRLETLFIKFDGESFKNNLVSEGNDIKGLGREYFALKYTEDGYYISVQSKGSSLSVYTELKSVVKEKLLSLFSRKFTTRDSTEKEFIDSKISEEDDFLVLCDKLEERLSSIKVCDDVVDKLYSHPFTSGKFLEDCDNHKAVIVYLHGTDRCEAYDLDFNLITFNKEEMSKYRIDTLLKPFIKELDKFYKEFGYHGIARIYIDFINKEAYHENENNEGLRTEEELQEIIKADKPKSGNISGNAYTDYTEDGLQNDTLNRQNLQGVSHSEPKGIAKLAFNAIKNHLISDLRTLLVYSGGIYVESSIIALVPSLDMVYIKLIFEKVERKLPNGRTKFGRPVAEEIGYIIGRRDVLISQYKSRLVKAAKWHYNNEVWLSEGEVDSLPFSLTSLFLNDNGDGLDMRNDEVQEILELFKESFETQLDENQAFTLVDGKVSTKSWYFDEEDNFRLNI